jgi:acetyl/propionyl-CoA carboxylase alpha subunit
VSIAKALYAHDCSKAAGFGEWAGWSNALRAAGQDVSEVPNVRLDRTLHFLLDGISWTWRDASMDPPERAQLGAADGRLIAPMNGKIGKIHVKAGDSVAAGSPLIVLEAMKMEHTLAAPRALRVKAVHVAPGTQASPGQLLLEFDVSPAP